MLKSDLRHNHAEQAAQVWLVNLFFGPGVAPTGRFLECLAIQLHEAGHEVEVLTGRVAYHAESRTSEAKFRGRVHGLFSGPMDAKRFLGKLLSWVCFYCSVAWYLATHRLPDKVLVMTTPPFLHLIVAVRNLFSRRPAEIILWNQDTYPEVLAAVGAIRRTSWLYRILDRLERWSVRRVDKAIALDHAMEDILLAHGARQVRTIPHWDLPHEGLGNPGMIDPALEGRMSRFRYVVIYTGNFGWGHDLSSLRDWWKSHPEQKDFFFLFLGGGEQWDGLFQWQQEQKRPDLEVLPYLPREQFEALVRRADLGLVALDDACVGLMSPSKIHSYLGYGKPLLYLGPARTNVSEAIEEFQCGFRCSQGDLEALGHCLEFLAMPEFDLSPYRVRALEGARSRYSEKVGVNEVQQFILQSGDTPVEVLPFDSRATGGPHEDQLAVPAALESQCA